MEFVEDIKRFGHDALTIKADSEPAMHSLQEDVQRIRGKLALLEIPLSDNLTRIV